MRATPRRSKGLALALALFATLALSAQAQAQPLPPKDSPAPELHAAARNDHASTIMTLLLRGADPNQRDAHGNTALHVAIREESEQAFNALLKHPGTDVGAINQAGETPLMLAAIKGRLAWCQALVKRGALVNEPGWSALHYAASGPEAAVVRWLLAQGAKLDARSPNGTTPLMMAAGYGGLTSVELLLAAGADPAARNDQGLDAAEFARRAGNDDLEAQLKRLAAARTVKGAKDGKGSQP